MRKLNEKHPLILQEIGIVGHLDGVQRLKFTKDRMLTEEVVIGNPKRNRIIGGIEKLIAVGIAVS